MKLIILCIDALDYEIIQELGMPKFAFEGKLAIPKSLYHKNKPHSLKIWPSIFSGRVIDTKVWNWKGEIKYLYTLTLNSILKLLRKYDWVQKINASKSALFRQSTSWRIRPDNVNIETVFTGTNSCIWNIPTITPECVMHFPSRKLMLEYAIHEYDIWEMIVLGMARTSYDITAAYCRILDSYGHLLLDPVPIYIKIAGLCDLVKNLAQDKAIMLIGDHGMKGGAHTDYAYIGCTEPISAKSVIDIRTDIENIIRVNDL